MMVKNSFKCLRHKPGAVVLSVFLLSFAIFLWMLSFAVTELSTATIPEKHLTVAVPNNMSDREVVYKAIEHIRTSVSQVSNIDYRVLLKAYAWDEMPYIPSTASALVSHADMCLLTVKINGLQSSDQWSGSLRTRYAHEYELEVVGIHELHELYADLLVGSELYMQLRTPMPEEDWAEQGKSYLIWGRLRQIERGGKRIYQLVLPEVGQRKYVEQNGRHLVYVQNTGEMIPTASEITDSWEYFGKTDMGRLWQELVYPAFGIVYGSADVVGTDVPDSIRAFNMEETTVIEGEMLTEEQCAGGERVCLVSEELAGLNGWAVGDRIPLSMYDGEGSPMVYHTPSGFFFESDYRIVGVYRNAWEYTGNGVGVHPNTVYVPLRSIENLGTDSTDVSLILNAGSENLFETDLLKLGYAGMFSYYSGPEVEDAVAQLALQEAREQWIVRSGQLARGLRFASVLWMAAVMMGWMHACRTEIGTHYQIETAERILFCHMLLQMLSIGLVSAVLSAVSALWLLPCVAARVLYVCADPAFADALTAALPQLPFAWRPLLIGMGMSLVCGLLSAIIGMKRRYHYIYRERSEL